MAFRQRKSTKTQRCVREKGILKNGESLMWRVVVAGQVSKIQMKKSLVCHAKKQNIHPVVSKVFYRRLLAGPMLKNVSVGKRDDSMMKSIWNAEIYKVKHGFN